MAGVSSRRYGDVSTGSPPVMRPLQTGRQAPTRAALVDGYRQDGFHNLTSDKSLRNPSNAEKTRTSVQVDLHDPVQMHLITETALIDSKNFQILSQEEADELRKLCQSLSQRIEQTRSNLAIQSKYRDAAISMSKLYPPRQGGGAVRVAEAEREAIQQRCEDLAAELWLLEKSLMEPQRRLLQHTAGILQLTHNTAQRSATPTPKASHINGMPASPESMYTTSNGRISVEPTEDDMFFAEGHRSLDRVHDETNGHVIPPDRNDSANAAEIPLKSLVRVQNQQLSEELGKLRDENTQLRLQTQLLTEQAQSLLVELEATKNQVPDSSLVMADAEQKLQVLNSQLRDIVVNASPIEHGDFGHPPIRINEEAGGMIAGQLDFLEQSVEALGKGDTANNARLAEARDHIKRLDEQLKAASSKLQSLGVEVQEVLMKSDSNWAPAPAADTGLEESIIYIQESLRTVEDELQRLTALSSTATESRRKEEQVETVLTGLWDIIQSGYADIRDRKRDRRRTRLDKGLEVDEDDLSDEECLDPDDKYSLSAFSTKVQWLYAQATSLRERNGVLKRQVKQQRELNNKTDSEKDEAIEAKTRELQQTRMLLEGTEKEVDNVRLQLSEALTELEKAQEQMEKRGSESSTAIMEVQKQIVERNAQIASLQAVAKEANTAAAAAEKAVEEKCKEIKAKDNELEQTMSMLAEYKMEATLAKAELDGAYGSRTERAKQAAALAGNSESSTLQAKIDELQPSVQRLEQELRDTVRDLKDITRQAIDAESKIAHLESELDRVVQAARQEKEVLQDALDREKLARGNSNSIGSRPSSGRPGASTIVTESYREALKAERKKYEEQLRNEQTNRRKLEEEVRILRRSQGVGKVH